MKFSNFIHLIKFLRAGWISVHGNDRNKPNKGRREVKFGMASMYSIPPEQLAQARSSYWNI